MKVLFCLFLLLYFSACTRGLIYSDTTEPITLNMKTTAVGTENAELSSFHIQEPITRMRISAEWNSRAIGDAAKQTGLDKIYYADMRTQSVLGGIWRRETIIVWGD